MKTGQLQRLFMSILHWYTNTIVTILLANPIRVEYQNRSWWHFHPQLCIRKRAYLHICHFSVREIWYTFPLLIVKVRWWFYETFSTIFNNHTLLAYHDENFKKIRIPPIEYLFDRRINTFVQVSYTGTRYQFNAAVVSSGPIKKFLRRENAHSKSLTTESFK